jgi:hypothetical protein
LTCSGAITLTQGTFTTNDYAVTATSLSSSNSNMRTINLGSSTVTLTTTSDSVVNFTTSTNLTFNAGTSDIYLTRSNALIGINGGSGVTFYNVFQTGTTGGVEFVVRGRNTFNNFTTTGPTLAGVRFVTFADSQTINGTLSTTGTAGNRRVWFRGLTYGLAQTLTINSAPSLTDADFRDIYVIGTAAPISGTRIGDLRGCRGITFDAPKTVYWVTAAGGSWSGNNWAASSGGGASTDNFPLAQDTAVIENTGLNTSATVTLDTPVPYLGTIDMSTRTNAMTLAGSTAYTVYGDWKFGSGVTRSYTGGLTFSGRNTQTITSAGKAFAQSVNIDTYGGTVELADALNLGTLGSISVSNGKFDTKNYNVTCTTVFSNNSNVREISFGSSTVTVNSSPVTFTNSTNLTFNAGTSQINCSVNGDTFAGGGQTFYNVAFTSTSTAAVFIFSGTNTFNNISFTAPTSAGFVQLSLSDDQTITGTLTCAGATAVRRIFLRSNTLGTTRTLTVNSLSADDCDFRDITVAGTAAGSSPTRAGDCGGNTGITFPAAKTVYWNLAGAQNWSATAWAPGSGGTPDINNFPLAQDTAVFDDTGSVTGTITIDRPWNIGTFDASLRTSAMTLAFTSASNIYGNWKSGTGLTFSGIQATSFIGRGTQTITSNGVQFTQDIIINSFAGIVQLADALSVVSTRTLSINNGTFDAVSYNVTIGLFTTNGTNNAVKMGSGTWTLSGTGSVWGMGAPGAFYKGTANIVFSDTSTAARTFTGGGLSYNKLTIGGTTGTSTLTITGNNQFTELASTKTVAHTIALGTTTQTFGAWTVTGTVGNVVTLTGTGTAHILAGACTSSIDYLAMGSIGFAATSPGEFYAGANSTGTAAAPVYRTDKPADSTRYWVGGTGNWSDTARWSTSSGGGSGASVPRSHDDVVFDSLSNATAYTATVNAVTGGIRTKALTIAGPLVGNVTLAGSTAIVGIHGDVTLPATGLTRTYTGAITLTGSSTGRTLTTNGVTLASATTVNGVGCEWTLGSAVNIGSSALALNNGSFDCGTYNLTAENINSTSSNSTTLSLGSSNILCTGTLNLQGTNFTFNAGTSVISNNRGTSAHVITAGIGLTFYDYSVTSTNPSSIIVNGANTFNNFSVIGRTTAGITPLSFAADQTINGTLTLSAGSNATMRTFVQSNTIGTTRTLTCAAFSGTDADFRDITIAGAAAPVSGTRLGDCKGNSGITFDAAKTVYWRNTGGSNWSGNWSFTDGGSADATAFPLAQDTAVFATYPTTAGSTATINAAWNIGTIDMSARTSNTMTLACSQAPSIYGNWINGTGTTLSGIGTLTFAGRGSQTITSAGVTFTQSLAFNSPSGSITLQDAFVSNRSNSLAFSVVQGTFDANDYNITLSGASSGFRCDQSSDARTVVLGTGTTTLAGTNGWGAETSTNLTVTGTGTISLTSASAKTFAGGGISYSGITLDQGGAGTLTISGNNTFANITNSYSATGATTIAIGTTTQTVGSFTASGEAGRVLTVQGTSASSPATLVFSGSGQATAPTTDYLTITGVRAYNLDTTWYAGANSTNNGSLGWYFEAGGGGPISVFIIESATSADAQNNTATISVSMSETTTAADAAAAGLIYIGALNEAATASDVVEALRAFLASVAESATSSELVSAALTLSAAISELTTGSDATAVTSRVTNPTIAELIAAADVLSGGLLFATSISETSTGADALANTNTTNPTIAEAATPSDALANANTTNPTISELITASETKTNTNTTNPTIAETAQMADSLSGGLLFLSSISEATTAQEIATAVLIFNRAVSEAATASEVLAAIAVFNAVVPESVSGSEVANALVSVGGSISEALTALDSVVNANTTRPNIAESATASESTTNVYTANPVIAETASPLDTAQVVASTFSAASAETAIPLDAPQGANTGSSSLSESATVSEAPAAQFTAATTISEASMAQESQVAVFVAATQVTEAAVIADATSVAPSTFSAAALAVAQAVESFSPAGSVYNAILPIQSASAADSILGSYLWNPIDDTQVPNWQNVNNAQPVIWIEVSNTQNPGWTPIQTTND